MKNLWDIIIITLSPMIGLSVITLIAFNCSRTDLPVEPDLEPKPIPCEPVPCESVACDPVPCAPCTVFDLTARFGLGGNNSFPDFYIFHRSGFPDEEIEITSRDTSFTRILKDYKGETFGIRIKSGSGAKIVSQSIVKYECVGG